MRLRLSTPKRGARSWAQAQGCCQGQGGNWKPGARYTELWLSLLSTAAQGPQSCECGREGEEENTHASKFKLQFSLWDVDVNLLGLRSRR